MVQSKAFIVAATLGAAALAAPLSTNEILAAEQDNRVAALAKAANEDFYTQGKSIAMREEDEGLDAREPLLGGVDGPPIGWMSPWWKGKPVGAPDIKNFGQQERQKREDETLEAREPILSLPFERPTHDRTKDGQQKMHIMPFPYNPGPIARDTDSESRELTLPHLIGGYRYDTTKPFPLHPAPNVRDVDEDLEAREPLLGVDGPPVGWMSPWWKGKPVGAREDIEDLKGREPLPPDPPIFRPLHTPWWKDFTRPGRVPDMAHPGGEVKGGTAKGKEEKKREELQAREPIPPPPFGYRPHRHVGPMHGAMPIQPAPSVRDFGSAEGLERRIPPPLLHGPPPGWLSPFWNGKPVGVSELPKLGQKRGDDEDIEASMITKDGRHSPAGWKSPWWNGRPVGAPSPEIKAMEVREPVILRDDHRRPPPGWKSPWWNGRPIGESLPRSIGDDELETREPMMSVDGHPLRIGMYGNIPLGVPSGIKNVEVREPMMTIPGHPLRIGMFGNVLPSAARPARGITYGIDGLD